MSRHRMLQPFQWSSPMATIGQGDERRGHPPGGSHDQDPHGRRQVPTHREAAPSKGTHHAGGRDRAGNPG